MSDLVIGDYTAAVTIDGSTHYLLIQPGSSSTPYKKINRNVFLGVTGQPAAIQDNTTPTKQAKFELSSITSATTRTFTLPDRSSTIATLGGNQVFTGSNTFTGSSWTGGTISNASIAVDAIAEFTVANGVTVDGLNIKDGALNNSVVTANITDAAVTPAKLQTGTGTGWSWSSWTPTFTNLSGGTLNFAKYIQVGKTVFFKLKYTLAGAGVAGSVRFTFPVAANSDEFPSSGYNQIGQGAILDSGTANFNAQVNLDSTTTSAIILATQASGANVVPVLLSSTVPMTWANSDFIFVRGSYEAA